MFLVSLPGRGYGGLKEYSRNPKESRFSQQLFIKHLLCQELFQEGCISEQHDRIKGESW